MEKEKRFLIGSNLNVFFDIAIKAQERSERLDKRYIKPIPGQPGRFVNGYDPRRGSFKNALIAVVFSGVYLEALLYVEALKAPEKLTKNKLTIDKFDWLTYEKKLKVLGVDDKSLLEDCKDFREGRNELVHEKPEEIMDGKFVKPIGKIRVAQKEAKDAVIFIKRIINALSERA